MVLTQKTGIEFAKNVVSEVDRKVKKVYWTNKEIDKWFGKRSAKEIINSGNTCFMNPCSDLTLVSSYIMNQSNLPHEWVIKEYLPTKNFNFNRLHFVLEFKYNNKLHVLNYKKLKEVYIYEGKRNQKEDLPIAQIIRIPSKQINLDKSLYEIISNFNIDSRLENYSLESNLNRLKQDNSLENYYNFKQENGKGFIIKQP